MYVYFIQGQVTHLVKIGHTRGNVYNRFRVIQANSPDKLTLVKVVKGNPKLESAIHRQFESIRSHGEWFYPSRGLMAYIDSLEGVEIKKAKNKRNRQHGKRENAYIARRNQKNKRKHDAQELYKLGISKEKIATRLGVSIDTVRTYLADIKKKGEHDKTTKRKRVARKMYASGISITEISKHLGVSYDTVWRYLKQNTP